MNTHRRSITNARGVLPEVAFDDKAPQQIGLRLQKEVMSQPGKSDRSLDCLAVAGPVVVEKAAISRASGLGPATVFCGFCRLR